MTGTQPLIGALTDLRPASLLVDVEPLLLPWRAPDSDLPRAVTHFGNLIRREARTVQEIVFITNSSRRLPSVPDIPPLTMSFISDARKPHVNQDLHYLKKPRAVVGDQILTDGLLALRLQSSFIQWKQVTPPGTPRWPIIQMRIGHPFRSLLFRKKADSRTGDKNRPKYAR